MTTGCGNADAPDAAWVEERIRDFVAGPANRMGIGDEPVWESPLVGFARGDDPIFETIRSHIGAFYWTPAQAFAEAYPGLAPASLTVIAWILPQTKATREENRRADTLPAKRWMQGREYGEAVNDALRDHLVDAFRERSVPAVAPCRLPSWRVEETETVGVASTWSERHACHAAGLGTFGLCDGLITRRGKAMRCGSVLVAIDLPPTPRAYASPYAWCLFYAKGACGACVRRCPVEAITEKGHDKMRCQAHLYGTVNAYAQKTLGLVSYGCGLCQTRVPCEGGIPPGLEQTGEGES